MPFVLSVVSNALGLLLAVWIIPQFLPGSISFTGGFWQLLVSGSLIGVINGVLRPLIRLLSLPLLLLTAGLFGFVINIGLLWFADYLLTDLTIHSILALVLTTVILAVVHVIL